MLSAGVIIPHHFVRIDHFGPDMDCEGYSVVSSGGETFTVALTPDEVRKQIAMQTFEKKFWDEKMREWKEWAKKWEQRDQS